MPFRDGQIVCQDGVDASTMEVMSYAGRFSESIIGPVLNPETLSHPLQAGH
jgi:hypothetical protein